MKTFGDDAKINNLLKTMEIMKYTDEQRRRYEAEFFAELEKKSELKAAKVGVEIISRASGLTVEEVEAL